MSADNFLGVYRVSKEQWIGRSCWSECERDCAHCTHRIVFEAKSLEEATQKARKELGEGIYEYGINFLNPLTDQREQLREKIARIICSLGDQPEECKRCLKVRGCPDTWGDVADQVDRLLALPKIAILDEDQGLPDNTWDGLYGNRYSEAQQDMLSQGWKKGVK